MSTSAAVGGSKKYSSESSLCRLRRVRRLSALLAATALTIGSTESAHAQSANVLQQWAGSSNGTVVGFDTPQQACESNQNSYIPAFGHEVFGLLSYAPFPGVKQNGTSVAAYACRYDSGPNGQDTIISLLGCTEGYRLVNGACLPPNYAYTAEPACDEGCRGIPGQYPAVGDPVSLSSGAKSELVTDYTSGGPYPIEIKRKYRSMHMPRTAQDSSGFGLAWRIDIVGRRAKVESYNFSDPYNVVISREDGAQARFLNNNSDPNSSLYWGQYSIETFFQNGQEYVGGIGDAKDKLRKTAVYQGFEYRDENDRVDTFNAGQHGPSKSVWKGGYQRNYVYATNDYSYDRPTQINDSLGRVINFTWIGNLISEIGLPDGTKLQYIYEARTTEGEVSDSSVLTQVIRRAADGSVIDSKTYQYAPVGRGTQVPLLTGVIDAAGKTIDSTTYDAVGRVLTAQGPGGAEAVSVTYEDQAIRRTVTNALGQVSTYQFAKAGSYGNVDTSLLRLTSVTRQQSPTVAAATMSLNQDFDGYLRTDWKGLVTREVYDDRQNETSRVEDFNGLKRTTTTVWSPDFNLPTQVVAPNLTINYSYDTLGRMTRREEIDTLLPRKPVSRIWTFTWNALGLLLTETGPRTDVVQTTSYTYDPAGNLATVRNALGHVTTVNAVTAAGLPATVTDPNGVVTNLTYDPLGRIAAVTVQGSTPATTAFAYDVNGLLSTVTSAAGVVMTYGYDDAHRLTSVSDTQGNKMVFALDGLGNRTQTQVQTGSSQVLMNNRATFDSLGRLLTQIGADNRTTVYQYDNNSNLTRVTDPRNAVTQIAFDSLNRALRTTNALNGVSTMVYDGQDNVTRVTDTRNIATTYTVNGFGFVTSTVSPDSGTTSYTYDLAGNVRTKSDGRKIVTNYTYDILDRLKTRAYPSATTENVTLIYDETTGGNRGIGQLTSVIDQAGTAKFVYDAYGNRTSETRTIGGINYVTNYGYGLDQQIARITYPSGLIVDYQRDARGQVAGVTMQINAAATPVALASNIAYQPFGSVAAMTMGNGVQVGRDYDLDYRLSGLQASGVTTVQSLALTYDGAENISAITDQLASNLSQTFTYDLLGRVTNGVGPYGNDNYTYDAAGNRLTRSLVNGTTAATTYTFAAANNRMATSVSGGVTLSYTYDAGGARTAVKKGNQTQAAFTYNAAARLATGGSASMKYNAFGERMVETITGGGTHFIFAPEGQPLSEQTVQGALVRNYVYLNGEPFAVVDNAGSVSYILNDHIGQPQKMLDSAGTVSWHRVAGIYGDTVSQPVGSTAVNPLRFPGQQFTPYTGLHYNYFRNYDPATGRYLEVDPIGLNGGLNPYIYVDGNPIVYIDRFGLCWYYSQSTGKLVHYNAEGKIDYSKSGGYAGAGKGKNNPAMQYVPNTGPIPQGTYTVGTPYNSKKTGRFSIPLSPSKSNNMQGRSAFLMHGDNKTGTASEGCIIFPRGVRETVNKSNDKCLKVTP